MVDTSYQWHAERRLLVEADHQETDPSETEPRLLVADSWLVADGRARATSLHRDRFFQSARNWFAQSELESFWDASMAALPESGRWFPRIEVNQAAADGTAGGDPRLGVRVRPAPATNRQVVLATHRGADPRTQPAVKGPDIPALNAARATVARHGADDAVIVDERGRIVDGATTAILWWREGILMAPPPDMKRVDSVTAKTLRLLAATTGIPGGVERARVSDLAGCRVWAVNALHGIRSVSTWLDGPDLVIDEVDDDRWIRRLAALQYPIR